VSDGSGHMIFPSIFAFIAAWPLTKRPLGLLKRVVGS
jgi:hypothetical protein